MNGTILNFVLRPDVGEKAAQRGFLPGQLVQVFFEATEKVMFADAAILSDASTSGEAFFRSRLHNRNLQSTKEFDWVVVRAPKVQDRHKTLFYPYPSSTSYEVPKTLSKFYPAAFTQAILAQCVP